MWLTHGRPCCRRPSRRRPRSASGRRRATSAFAAAHSNAAIGVFDRRPGRGARGRAGSRPRAPARRRPRRGAGRRRRGCRGRRSPSRRRGRRRAAAPAPRSIGEWRDVEARGHRAAGPGTSTARTSAIGISAAWRRRPSPRRRAGAGLLDAAPGEEAVAARPAGEGAAAPGSRSESVWPSIVGGLPKSARLGPRRAAAGPFEDAVLERHRQSRAASAMPRRLFARDTDLCDERHTLGAQARAYGQR